MAARSAFLVALLALVLAVVECNRHAAHHVHSHHRAGTFKCFYGCSRDTPDDEDVPLATLIIELFNNDPAADCEGAPKAFAEATAKLYHVEMTQHGTNSWVCDPLALAEVVEPPGRDMEETPSQTDIEKVLVTTWPEVLCPPEARCLNAVTHPCCVHQQVLIVPYIPLEKAEKEDFSNFEGMSRMFDGQAAAVCPVSLVCPSVGATPKCGAVVSSEAECAACREAGLCGKWEENMCFHSDTTPSCPDSLVDGVELLQLGSERRTKRTHLHHKKGGCSSAATALCQGLSPAGGWDCAAPGAIPMCFYFGRPAVAPRGPLGGKGGDSEDLDSEDEDEDDLEDEDEEDDGLDLDEEDDEGEEDPASALRRLQHLSTQELF
eukprot:gnl/Hemi2/167_TR50_c0_g1_i1.p1 gnl/Hemi2/167_TR50_c0_g1~~gnl/Hemi2/167_TR50_c0_g1_i1.p1  ORF type:complete len:377 (+),score=96.91 gnl/Hemi2/167_TR50_c0_g1_i1:39-1169(+)